MSPTPRSMLDYPLQTQARNHVHTHGQCKGATYRLISHRKVTMQRNSRLECLRSGSALRTWSALEHRDLCDFISSVATHRLQVTMLLWRPWQAE